MATCRGQMRAAIRESGEDEEDVFCAYQSVGDGEFGDERGPVHLDIPVKILPNRGFDAGYGGVDGEPVIGFGPKYIYVKVVYDGMEWVEAVPRAMESVGDDVPQLGG